MKLTFACLLIASAPTSQCMSSRVGQSMSRNADLELKEIVRGLRNLLPYLKDWNAWQREIARLGSNVVKLRKHRYARRARTLEGSPSILRMVLHEEKKEHAFPVNQLITRLDSARMPIAPYP